MTDADAVDIKTLRLYDDCMRLVNVKFQGEDERKLRVLQRKGLVISDLVRAAVRKAFEDQRKAGEKEPLALLEELDRLYPASRRKRPRIDVAKRKELSAFIRSKLRRRTGR